MTSYPCLRRVSGYLLAVVVAGLGMLPIGALAAQRTWIGGNNGWVDGGSTANWNPPDEPDPDDEAIFNSSNAVSLLSSNEVQALTMSGGIDLDTNGFNLTVGELVQLSGASTNLFVRGAASVLSARSATINSGAQIELDGGSLAINDSTVLGVGVVTINAGGTLAGHGQVALLDAPLLATSLFNNNGTISAVTRVQVIGQNPPANTLAINPSSGLARIDLDGSGESGVVNVNRNQTLDINVPLLDAFNGTLTMTQNTTLDISSNWTLGAGGIVNIDNGAVAGIPPVPAGTTTIAGGTLTQTGGTINVVDPDGTLIFNAPFTSTGGTFTNNGHVIFNATSSITAASLDLDAGEWTVQNNALLSLNLTDYDPGVANNAFDSTISLNNGDISVLTGDPKFVMNGVLNMHASSGITVWDGEPIDIGNDLPGLAFVSVTGTATSRFNNAVTFKSDAFVNVADTATLEFNSSVTFDSVNGANNAQFTGAGRLSFNGAITVNESTTLDMAGGTVDLDGTDTSGNLIFIGAPLEIHAASFSPFGRMNDSGGANRITIDALNNTGGLTVLLDDPGASWTLNPQGEINILSTNAGFTLLAGNDINLNGIVNITGSVFSAAQLDIGGFVTLNTVSEGLIFQGGNLLDPNRISGGLISGPGTLGALNLRALVGYGAINTDIDFEGTAALLADDGSLDVAGQILEAGTVGTADDDGVLHMLNPWNSSNVTAVSLKGGELKGVSFTVANPQGAFGHGRISSRVVVNTRITAITGTLVVDNPDNNNDWDGAGNTGQLRAESGGTLHAISGTPINFGGSIVAVDNSKVFTEGFDITFSAGSSIQLTQGTYESTNTAQINGNVLIGAGGPSTIKVAVNRFLTFNSTSQTTLNGDLRLESNNAEIAAGATFSGNGALVVPAGPNNLMAAASSNINVLVDMQGNFFPGGFLAVGRTDVKDYQQAGTGRFVAEIAGTNLNQFDRLVVNGVAQLGGTLALDLINGFVPSLGDLPLTIISATSGRIGTFGNVIQDPAMPAGLFYQVQYSPTLVQLVVVNGLPGDYNADGRVDAGDYVHWRNNLGDPTEADINNNGDGGDVGISDYAWWKQHYGNPGSGGLASGVPEPASAACLAIGLALVAFARPGRRTA